MTAPSPSTSLQNLNDIVMPEDVSWWPVAHGWYVLAALLIALLVFFAYRAIRQRRRNRYRRLALLELSDIRRKADAAALQKLPVVLKRTALSAWPRGDVAALTGAEWHRFLDRTASTELFCSGAGALLDQMAYGGAADGSADDSGQDRVLEAAEFWLRHHRADSSTG
jgi:hypothetical protein